MNPLTVSCIVFGCIVAGTLFGMILRTALHEKHWSAESKDLVKLGMGLIATMTALVLGLLVASAKSSFDTQRNGLAQLSGNIIFLDRMLAHYGPEAGDARTILRAAVADTLQRTWPAENAEPGQTQAMTGTEGRYEGLYDKIQELAPKNDAPHVPSPGPEDCYRHCTGALVVVRPEGHLHSYPIPGGDGCLAGLLLGSFSLFAPPKPIVVATLLICALAVSSAVFLILELDRPFGGMIQIPKPPLCTALGQLGR